jgi:hypothetical protein
MDGREYGIQTKKRFGSRGIIRHHVRVDDNISPLIVTSLRGRELRKIRKQSAKDPELSRLAKREPGSPSAALRLKCEKMFTEVA